MNAGSGHWVDNGEYLKPRLAATDQASLVLPGDTEAAAVNTNHHRTAHAVCGTQAGRPFIPGAAAHRAQETVAADPRATV